MPKEEASDRLTAEEKNEVLESAGLSSPQIFEVVRLEGIAELERPASSLFWSGIAAGLALSLSVYCKAFFSQALEGSELQKVLANLGYSVGFLIVVLGRLQLFTENTVTVVLPLLRTFTREKLIQTARLWAIVFGANMIGTFISALAAAKFGLFPAHRLEGFLEISRELMDYGFADCFLLGIPAGFLIASIVWLLPRAQTSGFWVILFLSYMIALGGMTHVVAGSTEYFLLSLNGELPWARSLLEGIFPTLLGNIIGGTGLFALIAYGQVKEEISENSE